MSSALEKIEDEVLKLPARSRARLAERLIASLEEVADPEAESTWRAEVEMKIESARAMGDHEQGLYDACAQAQRGSDDIVWGVSVSARGLLSSLANPNNGY